MRRPELAILVSTFERACHLKRSLVSIALQRGVGGLFEVVVTDDGSTDETSRIVDSFARQVDFPVRFTTHLHQGFQLARCRNEGVAASTAPYLLFTDGDCLLPPDHLRCHLDFGLPGRVVAGDCHRLDRETSDRVTEAAVRNGEYLRWIPKQERRRLALKAVHAWLYDLIRHPMLPRLTGNNIGIWRSDYDLVNGFDENFVGWGLEDRDLQLRLSRIGVRAKSILRRTATCHLWHPAVATFSRNGVGTANLKYYQRTGVMTRCLNGLVKWNRSPPTLPFPSTGVHEMLDKAA